MSFSKILVAIDFSAPSDDALGAAVALSQQSRASLHLLHVMPLQASATSVVPVMFAAEQITESIASAQARLEEARARVQAVGHQRVESTLVHGDPATEIVASAQQAGADLIIVGSHGRTGIARALMGSVAELVVRRASCPVLVWRSAA